MPLESYLSLSAGGCFPLSRNSFVQLTVSRTSLGDVPLHNASTPSSRSVCAAQSSIPLYRASTLCILVLMLSNGIDAYLDTCHQHTRSASARSLISITYTVKNATDPAQNKRAPDAPVKHGPPHRNPLLKHRKCREPHRAVGALLAQHRRQAAPQASYALFADQHADGAEQPAVREPAAGGGGCIVDHFGLDCLAGRDDGDALRHAGAEAAHDVDPRRTRLSFSMARVGVGLRAGQGV
ncbi:uncharacterized protein ColSpa_10770 [Colletotrichum spaethianum]|uniref:Uncharacterized protein n=1 Tax=Colletotrichum spaethianum TaxID=700344 RepID=A0AA37PEF5_9PEZI|nr:uncharacterized protein ColSpa_10770 [Colletotrichum spaethianum]GKT50590.1 hypothetical protein ColSpa_10770 [Colletotrichum spaethianum]